MLPLALAGLAMGMMPAASQVATRLPFMPGERMTYRVRMNGIGGFGHATMTVEGPVDVRGTPTYLLRSRTTAGIGFLKGSDLTESWLDPVHMAALRFHEHERHLLSSRDVRAEMYPADQRWVDGNGKTDSSITNAPLDELSFIYFLRSLQVEPGLQPDTTYRFDRHYDAARNPIVVRVTRGDTVVTPVGTFPTLLMEMHVRDPRRYHGEGVIRLYMSDDACRIPVRIESAVPGMGSFVLTIESYANPAPGCRVGDQTR